MPRMDELHAERAKEGLMVLGVTRYYDHGYLPVDMQELRDGKRGGKSAQKMDEAAFLKHLADFRENTKVRYPFAVGTAADMKNYGITGIPTVFVLDKEGRVTYAAVGGMKEHLLNIAIDRLLKKPVTGK
ncbi:MAG: hypothetical protein KBG84_03190 [Planctomycetes bacterium]|nr:hypothetical protein [Planctomycetota bacterium]